GFKRYVHIFLIYSLDSHFQNLSPVYRLHLTEKEIDKIFSRFFAQFLVKLSKGGDVAVQVGFHHVLENVAYLVISALLCDSPAVSFHKALFIKIYNDSVHHPCFSYGIISTAIGLLVPIG